MTAFELSALVDNFLAVLESFGIVSAGYKFIDECDIESFIERMPDGS